MNKGGRPPLFSETPEAGERMIEKEPGYNWSPKREKKELSTSWFAFIILLPAIVIIFGIVISPLITTFIYSLKNME